MKNLMLLILVSLSLTSCSVSKEENDLDKSLKELEKSVISLTISRFKLECLNKLMKDKEYIEQVKSVCKGDLQCNRYAVDANYGNCLSDKLDEEFK